jgi:hypothetical protein
MNDVLFPLTPNIKLQINEDMEWIRFLIYIIIWTGLTGSSKIFRLRRGPFGRRPRCPNDPVNPVQIIFF